MEFIYILQKAAGMFYLQGTTEWLRKIPFKSPELVNVLKVLTGLAKVKVNEINDFPKMIVL
ncbi:hypothetical protein [Acidianus infernus]|uniref:hypothetical protein n=1 Tax=Acidianus infernus TaxID=12915 RepID=UPI003594680A